MEWKIHKSNSECITCNKKFDEEEVYFSALFEETEGFIRKDYCPSCWANKAENGFFSFWKTKMPKKDKPVQRYINMVGVLDMFHRLENNEDTHKKNLRYVLALYLIRKKIFKLKSWKRQDGEEFIILYYPKENKEYCILHPDLKEEEIEMLTSELSHLLDFPYSDHGIAEAHSN